MTVEPTKAEKSPENLSGLINRIQERLTFLGLSARAASLDAGIPENTVQKLLKGTYRTPRPETLKALAKVLETSVSWLLSGADQGPEPADAPLTESGPNNSAKAVPVPLIREGLRPRRFKSEDPTVPLRRRRAGEWLRAKRVEAGLSQRKMASGSHYYSFISQIEGGQKELPIELWPVWATTLGCDHKDFAMTLVKLYHPDLHEMITGTGEPRSKVNPV